MPPRAARRLPGIYFEGRTPRLPEAPPRMDVAAFVGFAKSGPLDIPVALADAASFGDLFGADVELAWDRERSEAVRGNLAAAVRAYFGNGGARCWVVRVAGPEAKTNHYPVPGLLRLAPSGLRQAFIAARCEGSWSDPLVLGAVALRKPTTLANELAADGTPRSPLVFEGAQLSSARLQMPDTVAVGDVLQLTWTATRLRALAAVSAVDVQTGRATFLPASTFWLLPEAPPNGAWSASWSRTHTASPQPLLLAHDPSWRDDGTATLVVAGSDAPCAGQLVSLSQGTEQVWLMVNNVRSVELAESPVALGTQLDGRWYRLSAAGPGSLPIAQPVCERVRLELWTRAPEAQLRRLGDLGLAPGQPRYLGALPGDARLFSREEELLSDDERALCTRVREVAGDGATLRTYHGALWQDAANPRFALAADEGRADVYLPLALSVVPDVYVSREPSLGDAAERDGLTTFSAAPFIDPELADESTRSLPAQADHVRWQHRSPRRLSGMHALWDLEEPSIIAVPDAVLCGWSTEHSAPPSFLETPKLMAQASAERWRLTWNAVDPAAQYVLQQSSNADFLRATSRSFPAGTLAFEVTDLEPRRFFRLRAYIPSAPGSAEQVGSFWSPPLELITPPPEFVDCPVGNLGSPLLQLDSEPDAAGSYVLAWSEVPHAMRYRLEESSELDFTGSTAVFSGSAQRATVYGHAAGRYHYRVRAEGSEAAVGPVGFVSSAQAVFDVTDVSSARHVVLARYPGTVGDETVFDGETFSERFKLASTRSAVAGGFRYRLVRDGAWPAVVGDPSFHAFTLDAAGSWSAGVAVSVLAPPRRVAIAPKAYAASVMLSVQVALMRLAAARGDMLAVLALPEHYREDEAVRHVTALRAGLPEPEAWSYAALYYPWLITEQDQALLRVPPDGAACGVIGARAAARGAWVAPANHPFGDVLGLSPSLPRDQWQRLYETQVNLIGQEPHGFVSLGADTLSLDPDLVQINVRRLLSLLRRIALRAGHGFTFEPNSSMFRRAVERHFEELLDGMYRAGAFAGRSRAEAFQVAVDKTINNDVSLDQGRLIVDLKIAPSLPLSFLTVRLVQNGARGQVTESA